MRVLAGAKKANCTGQNILRCIQTEILNLLDITVEMLKLRWKL
nr:MAG TPA: hypothetical protein [Caudoviricetes sp.]